ncbi:MAG: ABC transporter permease [Verrucomicrobia bacterium Tous-C9LFEB]|nr:MAG: ABC transporter permease [Verrucomicrobia bacterium Tous-C9LFEB]
MLGRLVFRALAMRLRRVAVVFAALAVGAAIVTAMAAVYFDITAKMSRELRTYGANFYIGPSEGASMSESVHQQVIDEAPPGLISAGTPYLYGVVRTEMSKVVLMGVQFESLRPLVPYWQVAGNWIGVNFDDRNAMIGRKLAEQLELGIGKTVTLVRGDEKRSFQIKGLIETGDAVDNVLIVNLSVAQQWLRQPGQASHILLRVNSDPSRVDAFATELRKLHPDLDIRPIRKISASEGQVLGKIKGLMGLVCVVILILSTLCVNTTLLAIVSERSREFALQKALGATNRSIVGQIVIETALIVSAAVIAGCAAGYLLAQVLGQVVFSSTIDFRAPVLPLAALLSIVVALAAAIVPARRATQIEPAAILKGE